jgi:8-oxo-dGTP pyrophosphatase MutT (NUDIX family)
MGEDIRISCGIYLINSDNKLLIGHPTKHKPNVWSIPKGRIDEGESNHFEIAKRELLEETNIDLNKFDIDKMVEFELIRYRETNKYLKGFFAKVDNSFSDHDIKCTSMVYRDGNPSFPEFDDFKWVTIEDSKKLLHTFQVSNLDKCQQLIFTNERVLTFSNFTSTQ